MKKIFAVVLALVLCLSVFACAASADVSNVKLGVILLHDEDSTYDLNFINGVYEAVESLGLTEDQLIIKRNIPESNECYEAALDLVDEGCTIIFADSFGHENLHAAGCQGVPGRRVLPRHRHHGAHREARELPQRFRRHL